MGLGQICVCKETPVLFSSPEKETQVDLIPFTAIYYPPEQSTSLQAAPEQRFLPCASSQAVMWP